MKCAVGSAATLCPIPCYLYGLRFPVTSMGPSKFSLFGAFLHGHTHLSRGLASNRGNHWGYGFRDGVACTLGKFDAGSRDGFLFRTMVWFCLGSPGPATSLSRLPTGHRPPCSSCVEGFS
jgi:hypothetical protein